MKMNKKGFTLIELLVVVLIIGILAAIALPQYFKAVERSRASEALILFGTIAGAEQRYYLLKSDYTTDFGELDIDFKNNLGSDVTSGSSFNTQSFTITLESDQVKATRTNGKYKDYTLTRNYESGAIGCGNSDICSALGY